MCDVCDTQVTAVGSGASGTMLGLLLQSVPVETGRLVQQVWLSSPASGTPATRSEVAESHGHMFARCNCTSVACLYTLSTSDLLHCFYVEDWLLANGTTDLPMAGVSSLPLLVNSGSLIWSIQCWIFDSECCFKQIIAVT